MSYRLSEAAAACSLTKSTVRRAIKTGKVSATKDAHGQWHIEPAELHRVYPPRTEASADERIKTYVASASVLRSSMRSRSRAISVIPETFPDLMARGR